MGISVEALAVSGKRRLTEGADHVERLGSLPLAGLAQSAHGELAEAQQSLEDWAMSA